jgi:hypothetical protein
MSPGPRMWWLAHMQNSDKAVAAERRGVFGTPTLSGSLLALLFWWQSLTPTLIPRSWEMHEQDLFGATLGPVNFVTCVVRIFTDALRFSAIRSYCCSVKAFTAITGGRIPSGTPNQINCLARFKLSREGLKGSVIKTAFNSHLSPLFSLLFSQEHINLD